MQQQVFGAAAVTMVIAVAAASAGLASGFPFQSVGAARPPAAAASPTTAAALDAIEPGQWELREAGAVPAAPRSVCVADPATLLQIEHGAVRCNRFVVADQPRAVTVSYTCPGAGSGRTTIKLVSGSDFQLDTQGINGGAPFDKNYRAHRTGACKATRP